jgi:hypothetical protein
MPDAGNAWAGSDIKPTPATNAKTVNVFIIRNSPSTPQIGDAGANAE